MQFGVGNLPQEIVGHTYLARGAHQQIRVRNPRGVEVRCERRFVDALGVALARGDFSGECARGVRYLRARAVVERETQGQSRRGCGGAFGLIEFGEDFGGQSFAATDAAKANVAREHGRSFDAQKLAAQHHEGGDFIGGTLPVFAGERIERERVKSKLRALGDDATHNDHAFAMTHRSRKSACLRPTTVAIHDHGDMSRPTLTRH